MISDFMLNFTESLLDLLLLCVSEWFITAFFWTWENLLARESFRDWIISWIDFSARLGFKGPDEQELSSPSFFKTSQSSMLSKLTSWIVNLVEPAFFSMVTVFRPYLISLRRVISSNATSFPYLSANSSAFKTWFYLLEMLSTSYWLDINFSTPERIRYTYSTFMAEFKKLQILAS